MLDANSDTVLIYKAAKSVAMKPLKPDPANLLDCAQCVLDRTAPPPHRQS